MPRRTFISLFAVALIARLAWVTILFRVPIALDDMFQYDMLARSIAAGNGFRWYSPVDFGIFVQAVKPWLELNPADYSIPPEGLLTTFRAPLYPAFLAILYFMSGLDQRIGVARIAQAFLGASLAPLTAVLAARLGVSRRGAAIAGLILAVYPVLLLYPVALATENLFFPLVLLAAILLLRAVETDRLRDYAVAGAAFGAAMLTRSIIGAALVPIAAWSWRRCPGSKRGTMVLVGCVIAVSLPWAVRNSIVAGRPTPIETSMGYNLFLGYHPQGDGGFKTELAVIPLRIMDDAERDDFATREALGFIRADPGRVPSLMIRKFADFWGLEDRALVYFYSNGLLGYVPQPWLTLGYLALILPLVIVITLGTLGLAFPPDESRRGLVLGVIAGYLLPHVMLFAEDRFHLVLVPFIAAYAGHTLAGGRRLLVRSFAPRHHARWRWAAAIAVLLIFYSVWGWEAAQQWDKYVALAGPDGWKLGWSY